MKVEKNVLLDYIDRGFTINMIIDDMGITKNSLYYHISKYDILDKFKKMDKAFLAEKREN